MNAEDKTKSVEEKIEEFKETWSLSSVQIDHLRELFDEDHDPRHWKFEWSKIAIALKDFSIGLLMTHEKKSEHDARAVVDDVIKKARLG